MPKHDLDELSRRVEAAQRSFLDTVEAYQAMDAASFAAAFATSFAAPDLSDVTRELATEAVGLATGFD